MEYYNMDKRKLDEDFGAEQGIQGVRGEVIRWLSG